MCTCRTICEVRISPRWKDFHVHIDIHNEEVMLHFSHELNRSEQMNDFSKKIRSSTNLIMCTQYVLIDSNICIYCLSFDKGKKFFTLGCPSFKRQHVFYITFFCFNRSTWSSLSINIFKWWNILSNSCLSSMGVQFVIQIHFKPFMDYVE